MEPGNDGWAIFNHCDGTTSTQAIVFEVQPNQIQGKADLTFSLVQNYNLGEPHNVGRFRLSATDDPLFSPTSIDWVVLDLDTAASNFATLTEQPDFSILASGSNFTSEEYIVTASTVGTSLDEVVAFRLDVIEDASLPTNGPGRALNGNLVLTEFTVDFVLSVIPVNIDIKPGSFPNSINLNSGGATPVAILGSATLDVLDIDTATLTLGTSGVKTVGKKDRQLCSIADVSGDFSLDLEGMPDGFDDLVCHFETFSIVPELGDTEAKLSGNLLGIAGGTPIEGLDSVNIVP